MIRLSWVQARTQTMMAAALVAIVALVLAVSGPHLVHLYATLVSPCASHGDCATATSAFLNHDSALRTWLGGVVIAAPGLVGIFWGAPLVAREIEDGTFRLAWTQSVTRTRWLAVKLAVVGVISMAVAGVVTLAVTWWASPLDRANLNRFGTFDQRDLVPIGYAALAFALGVAASVVIRRALPAMATTLAAFVALRLAISHWIRPQLFAPAHATFAVSPGLNGSSITGVGPGSAGPNTLSLGTPNIPNAWIRSAQLVDQSGHAITERVMQATCPTLGSGSPGGGGGGPGGVGGLFGSSGHHSEVPVGAQNALQDCITKVAARYHEVVTYQPANRYWAFQWSELAICLAAAVVVAGVCLWWVRHRLA